MSDSFSVFKIDKDKELVAFGRVISIRAMWANDPDLRRNAPRNFTLLMMWIAEHHKLAPLHPHQAKGERRLDLLRQLYMLTQSEHQMYPVPRRSKLRIYAPPLGTIIKTHAAAFLPASNGVTISMTWSIKREN